MVCEKKGKVVCIDTEILGEKGSISAYLILSEVPVIVEAPPSSSAGIVDFLEDSGIGREDVGYVFITHIHLDHSGGAGELIRELPEARLVCHPRAFKHLVNPEKLWESSKVVLGELAESYGKPLPVDENRIVVAEDRHVFSLGNDEMLAIHTPGHAPHHLSFYLIKERMLFPGDSAGVYSFEKVVPTTPPPFRLDDALKSIDKMMELKPEFIAYTHFGISSSDLLKIVKEKMVLWSDLAVDAVKIGGVEELHKLLLAEDDDYRELFNLTKNSRIISGFHMMTLLGLIDYASRRKERRE